MGSLFDLADNDRRRLLESPRATVVSLRLFDQLPDHPIITAKLATGLCDATRPTATKAIGILCDTGILEETSGRGRDRTYCYREYLDQLRAGTELNG